MRLVGLILAVALPAAALAEGGGTPPPNAILDPLLEKAQAALERNDWAAARATLRDGLGKNPQNAEYHNLYAYSIRKGANPDMGLVFRHYNEALRIDPDHRGAHEYLGEAYLMVGNLAKAKEQLAMLDKLCFFSCREYRLLKQAVADYEKKAGSR